MAKGLKLNKELNKKSELFIEKVNSQMYYQSDLSSDLINFNWVDQIEHACPYIDNIVRNPKVALVREEDVVKVEKAKKVSVASIKDLSRHTHYIEKIDEETMEVQPSKILIERSEETFNTYENRFIFTLIYNLYRFVRDEESQLDNLEIKDERVLEYAGTTITGAERVNVELKITANQNPDEEDEKVPRNIEKEIEDVRNRLKKINAFIASWRFSELYTTLEKANVALVIPPIKKTNLILKNPNFQVAEKLWTFMQTYDEGKKEANIDGLDTTGNNDLLGLLDDSFMLDFFVLDSISASKREQKKRLSEYAVIMMRQQLKRIISLLLNSGVSVSDEEILEMITNELKKERNKTTVDSTDIKNRFKNEFDEFLDKVKNYI
ncbi:MAG: DUF2357 domain-containing protein [Bacilli bacterium]|nr:DUF2357 domain-containing protein [Bacilli bacterium]